MTHDLRQRVLSSLQGGATLQLAFVGVANGLFDALADGGATAARLAEVAGVDPGYVARWCDAAYAFELLDAEGDELRLSALGDAFRTEARDTLMGFAVSSVLGAHMMERTAGLMRTGERPGEAVLTERETVLPLFGPMLEHTFASMFAEQIVPNVPIYREVDERGGLVVDLGCGNGWYLRALARRCGHVRGLGLDGFGENVRQASELAAAEGLDERLRFLEGDIHYFTLDQPADLLAMNRALHHVWEGHHDAIGLVASHVAPGGALVIWEPAWPDDRERLRHPRARGMAFQNLAEHVQGNHFLRPAEIAEAMRGAGLEPEIHLFAEGYEAVVVGRRG